MFLQAWHIIVLILGALLPVVLVAVVVLLLARGRGGRPRSIDWDQVPDPVLHRWRTLSLTVHLLAVALALVVVTGVASVGDLGRGLLLAPLTFVLVHAVGVVLTQLVLGRMRGTGAGERAATL